MEQLDVAADPELTSILENLAKSNGFTMEELAANRAGRMSSRQRRRFTRWLFKFISIGLPLVIGPSLLFLVSAVDSANDRASTVIFGLLFLGFSSWRIRGWARLLWDIGSSRAASVEGRGVAFSNGSKSLPRSYYVIGGKRFPVQKDADEALARGVYYRAY
jgi:hypothetical protein